MHRHLLIARYKFILCENTECLNVTTVIHFYASTVHALGHRGHLFQVSHSPSTSCWSAGDNRLVYALFWNNNNNNDRLTAFDLWNKWKGNGQPANPDLESVRHCYSVRQKYYFVWGKCGFNDLSDSVFHFSISATNKSILVPLLLNPQSTAALCF